MKTSWLRCEKDLVDPIVGWELYSPRMNLEEIALVFAHSWFVAYDNIGRVSEDFVNFVCSYANGTSQDFRKLYKDDVMLRVVIKNVVSIACINRVPNADDILRRSLNVGFIDAKDGGHYNEDNEVKAQFKAMKPKPLGYTFSTLSKAIEIKRQMKKGQYVLQSMASPQLWGEALAQAMGYQEGELGYNPLVVVYQRLYYDLFVKEHNNIPENQLSSHEKIQRAAENEARQVGYKEYDYVKLNEALLAYTEYEGIKTTGRDSIWPRNNAELKDKTLAISGDLSKSKPFSVIVRKDSKNHNEIKYVIGTNEGLNSYRQLHPLASDNKKKYGEFDFGENDKDEQREATCSESICVLQLNGAEKLENILRLAAQKNPRANSYLAHRFKPEESRKVQDILKVLLDHPRVEVVSKHPWTLRWVPDKEYVDPFQSRVVAQTDSSETLKQISDSSMM
jgi:hypothetical protein